MGTAVDAVAAIGVCLAEAVDCARQATPRIKSAGNNTVEGEMNRIFIRLLWDFEAFKSALTCRTIRHIAPVIAIMAIAHYCTRRKWTAATIIDNLLS